MKDVVDGDSGVTWSGAGRGSLDRRRGPRRGVRGAILRARAGVCEEDGWGFLWWLDGHCDEEIGGWCLLCLFYRQIVLHDNDSMAGRLVGMKLIYSIEKGPIDDDTDAVNNCWSKELADWCRAVMLICRPGSLEAGMGPVCSG